MQPGLCTIMNKHGRLWNRIKRILREKKGFTFTELLVATLIMLLATGVLTTTLVLAIKHFFESTQRTEAQFLCGSLAEFIEDELSFSVVTDSSDLKWSKGTHNMGSNICFYVHGADGSYTKITDGTIGQYGKLVINGDNFKDDGGNPKYFKVVTDGSYEVEHLRGYSLEAGMSLTWDSTNNWYLVKLRVVDEKDKDTLAEAEFTVKPAVGTS